MVVAARGCSSVGGEGCGSWLHGGAALRSILGGGETHVESFQSRWSARVAQLQAEGNRTTHSSGAATARRSSARLESLMRDARRPLNSSVRWLTRGFGYLENRKERTWVGDSRSQPFLRCVLSRLAMPICSRHKNPCRMRQRRRECFRD